MAKKVVFTTACLIVIIAIGLCVTGRSREQKPVKEPVTMKQYLHAPPGVHIYKNTGKPLH